MREFHTSMDFALLSHYSILSIGASVNTFHYIVSMNCIYMFIGLHVDLQLGCKIRTCSSVVSYQVTDRRFYIKTLLGLSLRRVAFSFCWEVNRRISPTLLHVTG